MNAYPPIQLFVRQLWALSMVPEKDVVQVYTDVILPKMPLFEGESDSDSNAEGEETSNYTKDLDSYLQYFEATWIGSINKRTNIRGKPKFKVSLWNKYQSVKDDQADLTSNRSEAWNSASKISLPMKPNVWVVLQALQKEEGFARAKMIAAISGNAPADPNPGRTKLRLRRVEKLKIIVSQYGNIPIEDYLNAVVTLYNDE